MSITSKPHSKFAISYETISRIERITKTKVIRGMDKVLNNLLDKIEGSNLN